MNPAARLFASAILCGCLSSIAQAAELAPFKVGSWSGGARISEKDNFVECTATRTFGAQEMLLTQTTEGPTILGLADSDMHLRKGRKLQVEVTFDGQGPVTLAGAVIQAHIVALVLSPSSALDQLSKAKQLTAVISGQSYQFTVDQVAQVLPALSKCLTQAKASAGSAPGGKSADAGAGTDSGAAGAERGRARPERMVGVSGTGFVVSANGFLVTNDHVIHDCVGDISGNLPNGKVMTLRVVSTDQINDLALLQAPESFPDPALIRAVPIRSGEPVIAIGFPLHGLLTSDFTVTTGIVSSLSGILNDTRYLQTSAPLQPGNSGGPLFDTSGAVAGVAAMKLNALKFAGISGDIPQNVNFAIKTGALRDFLDNSAVPYKTASATAAALKTDQVATKARAHTMLISCRAKASAKE